MEYKGVNPESLEEIDRLKKLGLQGWAQDSTGVFRREKESAVAEIISFPESAYEQELGSLDSFWVYCRAIIISRAIKRQKIKLIWEIGAGSGSAAIPISRMDITVIATEPYYNGIQNIAKNNIAAFHTSLKDLNLPNNSINAVGIFDVLEHIENPNYFLRQISGFLAPNGLIFITVPAHQWLYSDFDMSIGHYRRYSLGTLDKELLDAGYERVTRHHFFSSLVVPALILRRIPYLLRRKRSFDGNKGIKASSNKLMNPKGVLNRILKILLLAESRLRLPFGLSVIGVYKKGMDLCRPTGNKTPSGSV